MITGQTYVVRYSPMASRALRIMQEQFQSYPQVSAELRQKISSTSACCLIVDPIPHSRRDLR